MCCEKCTRGGIATGYGQQLLEGIPPDKIWDLAGLCPKIHEGNYRYGRERVMWGSCAITSDMNTVECCRKCDYFS